MLPEIKNAYKSGRLMLLLGAGASAKSTDAENKELPLGDGLAQELAALMEWPYSNEALGSVYSAINVIDSGRLHGFLRRRLSNTRPSQDLITLASYTWSRIYTLNVDDAMEVGIRRAGNQRLQLFSRNAPLEDLDPIYNYIQLVKLNGSADRPEDGFIFSPQEYGEGSNKIPIWYRELGQNYSGYTFLFIGSKLNEPLFQHAMAEMRSVVKREPIRGYVLTPSATEIEKHHLSSLNLQHVPATLSDFVGWLVREMPQRPSGWDLATARRPELRNIHQALTETQKRALNSVTLVDADTLPRAPAGSVGGAIRDFYRGYKPRWSDILDEVPAELGFVEKFSAIVEGGHKRKTCISLVGPAGSGKSTALMIAALRASRRGDRPVYFLRESVGDIKDIMLALEQINSGDFFLFIDKIESMHDDVQGFLSGPLARNICVVFAERLNIWNRRVKSVLGECISSDLAVEKIARADVARILYKLEKYGPWTRLQQMPVEERVAEIYKNADRQLLIGLMEATTGLGFARIISNDFANVGGEHHKKFLVIAGLASIHRSTISSNIVGSALLNLGISEDVNVMSRETAGVVVSRDRKYSARHPAYVRELFERIVSPEMIRDCLVAVLEAFADYETPVIKNVSKADGIVFKSIINHRFIKEMMRNDEAKVVSIYENFETKFHVDGLYWLQYGLALRGFGRHPEALERFKTARQAYHSPHIEHAYAQQLLIMSNGASRWEDAEPLLNEAIDALRALDRRAEAADTYPIVTLAEGHISVMIKFFGVEGAKKLIQQYANELLAAHKRHPSQRLEYAVQNVLNLATTGSWKESYDTSLADAAEAYLA